MPHTPFLSIGLSLGLASFSLLALAQTSEDEATLRAAYAAEFAETCLAEAQDRVPETQFAVFEAFCGCAADSLSQAEYDLDALFSLGLRDTAFQTPEVQACYAEHLAPLTQPKS